MNVTINSTEVGASPPGLLVIQPGEVYPPTCVANGLATSKAIVGVRIFKGYFLQCI